MDSRGLRGFRGNSGKMQGKFRGNSEGGGVLEIQREFKRDPEIQNKDSGGFRRLQGNSEGFRRNIEESLG